MDIITLCASLPLLLIVILMVMVNMPAKKALPIGWALSVLIALFVWKQNPLTTAACAIEGCLESISTFMIIFGAILVMNVLKQSGAMAAIEKIFNDVNPDRRIQAIIVGFCFGAFIEGAAGFGTPAALAAPLLITLGFPPLCAAIITLVFNTVPVSFGAVGVPTITAINVTSKMAESLGIGIEEYTMQLSVYTAVGHAVCCLFVVFLGVWMMCKGFGPTKRGKDALPVLPFALFTAVVFDGFYLLMAYFFGPEFPSLIGSLCTLCIVIFSAKKGFLCPKNIWNFAPKEKWKNGWLSTTEIPVEKDCGMKASLACLPYLLIAFLLVATRLDWFGLKAALTSESFTFRINSILGKDNVNWAWNWGWCPGIMPMILVCMITVFIHKMSAHSALDSIKTTVKQTNGAMIALMAGVSMVFIYRNTGMDAATTSLSMTEAMASSLAEGMRNSYQFIAAGIGALGSFMSGSNTVSNTLFASLQFQTAVLADLSPIIIVALQNIGGAAGNMICVNNIVAVCATTGNHGNEGRIIRANIIPCVLYCLLATIVLCFFC